MAKKKAARPQLSPEQKAHAALWLALSYAAKKRANREAVEAGASVPIEVSISAKVGNRQVSETLHGPLTIGHDQVTASSAAPDTARLLAHVLSFVPKTRRAKLIEEIKGRQAANGSLAEPDDEALVQLAANLLAELRVQGTKNKKGAVAFAFQDGAEGAA